MHKLCTNSDQLATLQRITLPFLSDWRSIYTVVTLVADNLRDSVNELFWHLKLR